MIILRLYCFFHLPFGFILKITLGVGVVVLQVQILPFACLHDSLECLESKSVFLLRLALSLLEWQRYLEIQKQRRERGTRRYLLLVHSPEWLQQEPGTPASFPTWIAGTQAIRLSSAVFVGTLTWN